jgi:hypothetical protein
MTITTRLVTAIVVVTLASLACSSPGAAASEGNGQGLSALLDSLKKAAAAQAFVGTVVISEAVTGTSNKQDVIEKSKWNTTIDHNVVFTVSAPGQVVAKITYSEKTRVDSILVYQTHTITGTKTEETIGSGTSNDPALDRVTVDLRGDGNYQINFGTGGVPGSYTMEEISTTTCNPKVEGSTCRPSTSKNGDSAKPTGTGGISGSVDGITKTPGVLVGSMSEPIARDNGATGIRTVSWDLAQKK